MLTATAIQSFEAMAMPDRSWTGTTKNTCKPGSDVKTELRLDLIERQGGLCPVCGGPVVCAQFNHVVSRGSSKNPKGFIEGNIFAGCAVCNLKCAIKYGTVDDEGRVLDGGVIPIEAFERPDLVPFEWTPFPILRARRKAKR